MEVYLDTRIAGTVSHYVSTDDVSQLMLIPSEIRKCVAFVAVKHNDSYDFLGTAFFVAREKDFGSIIHLFAITAKHLFRNLLPDDEICLRLNLKNGSGSLAWYKTLVADWTFHPSEEDSVDVAVYRFSHKPEYDHLAFPLRVSATQIRMKYQSLNPGQEVFMAGLFANHQGQNRNIPIIRVGNIAARMEEKVNTKLGLIDAYLIEVRSIGGLSGSPVFLYFEEEEERPKSVRDGRADRPTTITERVRFPTYHLLGLIYGHFDSPTETPDSLEDARWRSEEKLNTGIAIVVPVEKIIEVLNHPKILDEDERIEEEKRKSNLPTED